VNHYSNNKQKATTILTVTNYINKAWVQNQGYRATTEVQTDAENYESTNS